MKAITDKEFRQFQQFIFDAAGITLPDSKKILVSGRLSKRLQACELESFSDYLKLLGGGLRPDEVQRAVDLLTTNETYFFREIKHFEFLRAQALEARGRAESFRVWSAASSSGEEAFSIAMVLADCLGDAPWEVLGTDISSRVLAGAERALYTLERGRHIPESYLRRFCMRGVAEFEGSLLVQRALRNRVKFRQVNLNVALPELGQFDIIFLRNVMIYFSDDTKRQVVARLLPPLKKSGYLLVGHSESLNDISRAVKPIAPSIYCRAS
jgi:chemotaxis protein methyltransferase CheR